MRGVPYPLARWPWLAMAAYLCAYVLLDWASYIRPLFGFNITPWNPQQAIAVALLVAWRRGGWLVWGGLLVAEVAVRGMPTQWAATLGATGALTLTLMAIARTLVPGGEPAAPFETRTALLRYVAVVAGGSLLGSVFYVGILSTTLPQEAGSVAGAMLRYWVGDAVGLLVTLPCLLLAMDTGRRQALADVLRSPAWWASAALTCGVLSVIFGHRESEYFKYFYLLLLPLVWAPVRYGVAAAALSSVLAQVGLIVASQIAKPQDQTVFELQVLMAASAMTALLLGVLVDERARAQAQLRAGLRFSAAGQMSAALAHELSQPLTAINQFAQACQMLLAAPPDDRQRGLLAQTLGRLLGETRRAGEIAGRLRDFFSRGATSLQRQQLGPAVDQALSAHAEQAQRCGVRLGKELGHDLPPVWVDEIQLAVVLRNLLANAVESASAAPSDRSVTVKVTRAAEMLQVEVVDSGPGIAATRLGDLFDGTPSTKAQGLGVGLSICRAIVEAHGGKLWAQPGPGGRFFFTLPIDEHEAAAHD